MNAILIIGLIILCILLGPWLLIWSINTLFSLAIIFTFKNWLAAFVLLILIGSSSSARK